VLARLWGALAREPIPGLGTHETIGDTLAIKLPDGRTLRGPAGAAATFAVAPAGLAVTVDGAASADPAAFGDPAAFDDPAVLLAELGLPGRVGMLADELANSVANLSLARAAQPEPDGGAATLARASTHPDPLAFLEQCVVDGHPLHPCCRTRIGLSPDEVRAYAPEHRPTVNLHLVRVPADRWRAVQCPPLLYVHPWQHDHVLDAYPWLERTGRTVPARPLMSLRTLAMVDVPGHHVKTAVNVQMTSAVRTVSPAAIHNGPALSALLIVLASRTPTLMIVPEVGAGAALVDAQPCRSLAMVYRKMPPLRRDEVALPLAVLAAPSPADGRPIVVEMVRDHYGGDPLTFIGALATLMLPPLLTLLEFGVALEAHGQNLLVVLRDGKLARLLYRDMGGLRVSPARLRRHGIEPPEVRGDLACDDPEVLRTKLFASAVSTVLSETVAVLGRELGADSERAWARIATVARAHGGPDAAALFGHTLPLKATTTMRLAADPLEDVWTHLPNPMGGLS
jgi:siderophore synthetase component